MSVFILVRPHLEYAERSAVGVPYRIVDIEIRTSLIIIFTASIVDGKI